jgi:hypothetical protein
MSDSSPTIERKPRRKAPVIQTSQDSPVQPQPKRMVPPSPGPPVLMHGEEAPPIESQDVASQSPSQQQTKRQQMLQNPLFDLQAKEGDSGDSVDGTENSEDDAFVSHFIVTLISLVSHHSRFLRHLPNLSNVTDGSYSDGDRGLYLASLASQGEGLGFGTPMHQRRRGVFQ